MQRLKIDLEQILRLGEKSIIVGQEFSSDSFTSKQLDSICETINDVWYCIDKDYNGFQNVEFDTRHAEMCSEHLMNYLGEVSPKYKGTELTKDLLGKVSGDFYAVFYQSIKYMSR